MKTRSKASESIRASFQQGWLLNQLVVRAIIMGCCWINSTYANFLPAQSESPLDVMPLTGAWQLLPAQNNPADIYLPQAATSLPWQPITLPANWHSTGHDYAGAVWHRRTFNVSAHQRQQLATLVFQGVDYRADVWLNGHYLGFHAGYFEPFAFDVTPYLQDQDNVLVVKVDSPDEMPDRVWSLHKQLIKGVLNHHDTRPGGAWSLQGQDANSGGIWQTVYLRFSDQLAIDQTQVQPQLQDQTPATTAPIDSTLIGHLTLHGSLPTQALTLQTELLALTGNEVLQHNEQVIAPEQWQVLAEGRYELPWQWRVNAVQRWWPAGYGAHTLYRVRVTLRVGNTVLDRRDTRVAFRSIRYSAEDSAFYINGHRLFLRGTNYIASPWLAEVKPSDYERDLRLMLAANINAIRVHAHVAGQAFYDLADQLGLLLWQDFPLQWGYDDSVEFRNEAQRQAQAMVQSLAQHPAIFAWCAHNEPPWDADWMQYKYPDYKPNQNRELTAAVAKVLATDTTRYNHAYSAGREHLWQGWYSGNWHDHAKAAKVSIVSEFGAQALPELATFKTIIPEADWWPKTTDSKDPAWQSWQYHNFQPQETFRNAGVMRGDSIVSFIQNSQSYQAQLIQLAAESYRRQRYQPVAAAFHFMFTETWPSINWGVVDYLRHPKAGYFALQKAFQPLLPSIEWDADRLKAGQGNRVVFWLINDRWQSYPQINLQYRLLLDGKLLKQDKRSYELPADSGRPVWELQWPKLAAGQYVLDAVISDKQGKPLADNQFRFVVENP